MLPKEEKQIVLTLTNSSSLNSSTFSLLSFPSNETATEGTTGATATGQEIGIDNSSFVAAAWRFFYNGVVDFFSIVSPTDIDSLITSLNGRFGDIFWKEVGTTFNWNLRVASSEYTFGLVVITLQPSKNFSDFASNFISGTTTSVSVGYDTVTYNGIVSELSSQPYMLTTVYVSSTNLTQLQYPFSVNLLDQNGVASTRPIQPIIDPNQSQSVNVAIPIYMTTGALNAIQYTIEPSGSVLMIIRYEHVDLFDAAKLIDSGKFQKEMLLLKQQDEEEYKRVVNTLEGFGFVENPVSWTNDAQEQPKIENRIFAVPLFYVIAKNNGNNSVKML